MQTLPTARTARRLLAAVPVAAVLALGASAAPASAAPALIHVNACDLAAKCAGGNATGNLTTLVKERAPELMTLNEVCSATVARVAKNTGYKRVFTQAGTQRCQKGRGLYGNAILAAPTRTLKKVLVRTYNKQQPGAEKRVLLCADSSGLVACVTHLDHKGLARAQGSQLRYLLNRLMERTNPRVLLGADLNLSPQAARAHALPKAMRRIGDDRVMHIFYAKAFGPQEGLVLKGTLSWTDHAGLQLTGPRAVPSAQPAPVG